MSLEVAAYRRMGSFCLDVQFTATGRLTALFGGSGSGKTTVVNIIAGLLRPERGRVVVDGRVLLDTSQEVFVPKHRRRIGYVFQDSLLFPHLTVRQNLLYGRRFVPAVQRKEKLERIIELLGIGGLLNRRPTLLSGGEKQRIATGRALLTDPQLLLMDEPLSSLDEKRKAEILPYLERLRDESNVPIVYVSHAVAEVTRLASTVVLMSHGRVIAQGSVSEVLGRVDLSHDNADYELGSVLEMEVCEHLDRYDLTKLCSAACQLLLPKLDVVIGTVVRARILARDVVLATKRPEAVSALNVLPARIVEIDALNSNTAIVQLDVNGERLLASVTRLTIERLDLRRGMPVFAIIKTVAINRQEVN